MSVHPEALEGRTDTGEGDAPSRQPRLSSLRRRPQSRTEHCRVPGRLRQQGDPFVLRVPSARTGGEKACPFALPCPSLSVHPEVLEGGAGSRPALPSHPGLSHLRGFLDCGLRRNDGVGFRHKQRLPGNASDTPRPVSLAFRHCGVGRNPERSAAGFQGGSCQGVSPVHAEGTRRANGQQAGPSVTSQPVPPPGFPGLRPTPQ